MDMGRMVLLWCEDCRRFESDGLTGEGVCKAPEPIADVWYGHVACENFQEKEETPCFMPRKGSVRNSNGKVD